MAKEADDPIKRYSASLTPEERQELARALLAETPNVPPGRLVGPRLLLASRALFVGVFVLYWSWRGFTLVSLPSLLLGLWLPGVVVLFPNELSRAVGRLGATVRIDRPSAPRVALALAWFIVLLPLMAEVVRAFSRAA